MPASLFTHLIALYNVYIIFAPARLSVLSMSYYRKLLTFRVRRQIRNQPALFECVSTRIFALILAAKSQKSNLNSTDSH